MTVAAPIRKKARLELSTTDSIQGISKNTLDQDTASAAEIEEVTESAAAPLHAFIAGGAYPTDLSPLTIRILQKYLDETSTTLSDCDQCSESLLRDLRSFPYYPLGLLKKIYLVQCDSIAGMTTLAQRENSMITALLNDERDKAIAERNEILRFILNAPITTSSDLKKQKSQALLHYQVPEILDQLVDGDFESLSKIHDPDNLRSLDTLNTFYSDVHAMTDLIQEECQQHFTLFQLHSFMGLTITDTPAMTLREHIALQVANRSLTIENKDAETVIGVLDLLSDICEALMEKDYSSAQEAWDKLGSKRDVFKMTEIQGILREIEETPEKDSQNHSAHEPMAE